VLCSKNIDDFFQNCCFLSKNSENQYTKTALAVKETNIFLNILVFKVA
jgi:hypothetical protein